MQRAPRYLCGPWLLMLLPFLCQAPAAVAQSLVQLNIVDAIGTARPAPFAVYNVEGGQVAVSPTADAVMLSPGYYLVEAAVEPWPFVDVEISDSPSVVLEAVLEDALWLELEAGPHGRLPGARQLGLFRPLPLAEAAPLLAALRDPSLTYPVLLRRPEATDAEVAAGLDAARRVVAWEIPRPAENSTTGWRDYWRYRDLRAHLALPALAAEGTRQDLETLHRFAETFDGMVLVAQAERRLGMLEHGLLAGIASSESATVQQRALALGVLHAHGASGAGAALMRLAGSASEFLTLPSAARDQIVRLMLRDDPEAAVALAETVFTRAVAVHDGAGTSDPLWLQELGAPLATLLILAGRAEVRREVRDALEHPAARSLSVHPRVVELLGIVAQEPDQFIRHAIDVTGFFDAYQFALLCVGWRMRSEGAAWFIDRLIMLMTEAALEDERGTHPSTVRARIARGLEFHLAPCRPSAVAAKVYFEGVEDIWTRWFPGPDDPARIASAMEQNPWLDLMPLSRAAVLEAWPAVQRPEWTAFQNERMALFRAFGHPGDIYVNRLFDDGLSRRIFLLRHPVENGYSGAISGLLEVRPARAGDGVAVALRLDIAAHYNSAGGLADAIATGGDRNAWAHHGYVLDPGRLIARVGLRDTGGFTEMHAAGHDDDGFLVFVAPVPLRDRAGSLIEVQLALHDDRKSFLFPALDYETSP